MKESDFSPCTTVPVVSLDVANEMMMKMKEEETTMEIEELFNDEIIDDEMEELEEKQGIGYYVSVCSTWDADDGRDIGRRLLGKPGAAVGAAIGGAKGAVRGLFEGIKEALDG